MAVLVIVIFILSCLAIGVVAGLIINKSQNSSFREQSSKELELMMMKRSVYLVRTSVNVDGTSLTKEEEVYVQDIRGDLVYVMNFDGEERVIPMSEFMRARKIR